jgi:hypothetical protein
VADVIFEDVTSPVRFMVSTYNNENIAILTDENELVVGSVMKNQISKVKFPVKEFLRKKFESIEKICWVG